MCEIRLEDSDETKEVLGVINANPSERNLLVHVLNVSRRNQPCGYFGKLHDERGFPLDGNNDVKRCLAVETNPERKMACPFYNPGLENKCRYQYNKP